LAAAQWLAVELPSAVERGSPLAVTLRLRNTSAVAASRPTHVQFAGFVECGWTPSEWGGGPNRVAVPALAPGQTLVLRVVAPDAAGRCSAQNPPRRGTLRLAVDPDRRALWGRGHESQIERTYDIR